MDTSTNLRVGDILLWRPHGSLYVVVALDNKLYGTILNPMVRGATDYLTPRKNGTVPMFHLLSPIERWMDWEVIGHAE